MASNSKKEILSISIIGSGNVAFQLGNALYKAGSNLHQIISRNKVEGEELAQSINATYYASVSTMEVVDVVIIAVSDDAIEMVSNLIPYPISANALILHTSGSVSGVVLQPHSCTAVVWPLQTIRKNSAFDWKHVPFVITTEEDANFELLQSIFGQVSDRVVRMSDKARSKLHIPAVIVNNFTTYLYGLALDVCEKEKVDFSLLFPLIQETTDRLSLSTHPISQLTGPAKREDKVTISKHLEALKSYPETLHLYATLSKSIIAHKKGHSEEDT